MKRIVDLVNFNADASCLSTQNWFRIMEGGDQSLFCRWLRLYTELKKKLVLGLTGATIADLSIFNPEAIKLIARSPEIFQTVIRPFIHDIALLRTATGFRVNLGLGILAIKREFGEAYPYFLPPEFMLTSEQIAFLSETGIRGVFINPARFSSEVRQRIPTEPYIVKGVFNSSVECLPVSGEYTSEYLKAIQLYDNTGWNRCLKEDCNDTIICWRDGESSFLLPGSLEREEHWLKQEDSGLLRIHLCGRQQGFYSCESNDDGTIHSYPLHPFLPWMREFRTLSFVSRVQLLEQTISEYSYNDQCLSWLLSIGSDILSAIEKASPVVKIKNNSRDTRVTDYTILRSERGFEGEEFLLMAEICRRSGKLPIELMMPDTFLHHRSYLSRFEYLRSLFSEQAVD